MAKNPEKSTPKSTPARRKYTAPRPMISVTQDNIDKGLKKQSGHCMIFQAIHEQVPDAFSISVDLQTIRFSDRAKGLRYVYLTPRIAQDALIRWDYGVKPPPFKFRLRGAHVTSMRLQSRGKRHLAHKLGRRKLSATKSEAITGVVPEIIGGNRPARHPSAIKARQFGLRGYTLEDVVPEKAPSQSRE